jgi:hypothetical protein
VAAVVAGVAGEAPGAGDHDYGVSKSRFEPSLI